MSPSDPLYIPVANGVQLAATSFGQKGDPVVVLMHGAGQTRHSWRDAGDCLARAGWHAVAVDTRGHGDSDWAPDGDYSVDTLVSDLVAITMQLAQGHHQKPVLVGASLGGICGMLAEGEAAQQLFHSLVLVDITPRIDNTGVARIIEFMSRYQAGFASLAEAASAVAAYQSPGRRELKNEAGPKLKEGLQQDGSRQARSDGLKKNLRLADDGRYYWHWDPGLMQHIGTIDEEFYQRQRSAASRLELPVLLIRGQQSEIVSSGAVEEFLELVPHAQFQDIANAAHMVAGDSNDIFADTVLEFIGDATSI